MIFRCCPPLLSPSSTHGKELDIPHVDFLHDPRHELNTPLSQDLTQSVWGFSRDDAIKFIGRYQEQVYFVAVVAVDFLLGVSVTREKYLHVLSFNHRNRGPNWPRCIVDSPEGRLEQLSH